MKLLILGYSNIVKRRVLPALAKSHIFTDIELASRKQIEVLPTGVTKAYCGYQEALESSGADIVYVSMINSEHEFWTRLALEMNHHVIVDKPAFLNPSSVLELSALARNSGKLLAEANVYSFHPQIDLIGDLFKKSGSAPTRILTAFSVPPFEENNFRNTKELGGGALWDLGPYAASLGRVFFDAEPKTIDVKVVSKNSQIDTAFSMLMTYSGERSIVGHFGFDTEYRNFMNIFGPNLSVTLDRVFTTTPDLKNSIHVKSQNQEQLVASDPADSFALFFKKITDAIRMNNFKHFTDSLSLDARVLKSMRSQAEL